MKKQVNYSKFISRIFSSTIDMFILTVISTPIMRKVQEQFVLWKFKPYLISHGVNATNPQEMANTLNFVEFTSHLTYIDSLTIGLICITVQSLLIGSYLIYFWSQKGWTPGKYIAGIKVVDSDTLDKISVTQAVKRFFSLTLFLVGVWFIFFTEKRQALYDKIANTVVIKR